MSKRFLSVLLTILFVGYASSSFAVPKEIKAPKKPQLRCQEELALNKSELEDTLTELGVVSLELAQCSVDSSDLAEDLKSCQNEYGSLFQNYTQLEEDYASLTENYQSLVEQNGEAAILIADLTTQINNLVNEKIVLTNTVQFLTDQNQALQNEYTVLFSVYQEISMAHDGLGDKYEELVSAQNNLKDLVGQYENVLSPNVPYVITGNFQCIKAARSTIKKFISKAKKGVRRLKLPRRAQRTLINCQANELSNQGTIETLKTIGIKID